MSNSISSRHDWKFGDSMTFNKDALARSYFNYMIDRCCEMFEVKLDGVPDDTPKKKLLQIIFSGFAVVFKHEGKLYFDFAGLGGLLDAWRRPKTAIITNPYIPFNKQLEIDKECVLIKCDSTITGLYPMFEKYSYLLAETDLSLKFADINSRFQFLLTADNDQARDDAQKVINNIVNGDSLGVIGTKAFLNDTFKGLSSYDIGTKAKDNIKDLIELSQYLKSQWYIDLGLNANYNMKREAINSSESGMNDDVLLPLVDNILGNLKEGFEKVNRMFSVNWSVELNSSWKAIHENYHADQDGIDKTEESESGKDKKENEKENLGD